MSTSVDRVRELIAASGMSQGEFADAVGLDAPKLSKSLAGTRRFTSLDVARIAEVGQVSVDWLLGGQEPALATAARRAAGTSSDAAVSAARRLTELRRTADQLGYPSSFTLPSVRVGGGTARSIGESLAKAAQAVLAQRELSSTAPDLAEVIEQCFGIDVAIDDLGDGFDGLSAVTAEARVILASPTSNGARQRFTIAHELGHLLAQDDQGVHLDQDVYALGNRAIDSEVCANAFASAFLMPKELLTSRVTPGLDEQAFAELALDLSVSPSALAVRLSQLRFIDQLSAERFKRMTVAGAAQLTGRIGEVGAVTQNSTHRRTPALLARDLQTAYFAGRTTLRPWATLLYVSTEQLRDALEKDSEVD